MFLYNNRPTRLGIEKSHVSPGSIGNIALLGISGVRTQNLGFDCSIGNRGSEDPAFKLLVGPEFATLRCYQLVVLVCLPTEYLKQIPLARPRGICCKRGWE